MLNSRQGLIMTIYEWIDRKSLKGVAALVVGFILTEKLLKPKEQQMGFSSLLKAAVIVGGIKYFSDTLGEKVVTLADKKQSLSSNPVSLDSSLALDTVSSNTVLAGGGLKISNLSQLPKSLEIRNTPTL